MFRRVGCNFFQLWDRIMRWMARAWVSVLWLRLVGLRNALSEGIERLRWLIDYGYNSPIVPNGRREKPKSRR